MDEELIESLNDLNRQNLELISKFSPAALVGGFIFGIAGFYFFRNGKKQTNHKVMIIGIVLMVYPLFFTEAFPTWAIGIILTSLAYYWMKN